MQWIPLHLTEQAKELLALEPIGEQLLSIATFGSNKEQEKVCAIVSVGMAIPLITLCLYVVTTSCDPLVSKPIAACIKNSSSFKGLDIADHSHGKSSLKMDVLVGSDYYWELVTESV